MILFCLVLMLFSKFLLFPHIVAPAMDLLGSKSQGLAEFTGMYGDFYTQNSWLIVSAFSAIVMVNVHLAMKK
ncbi:hypothetical protein [Vibrio owensii]|uniref:hypothetical protein n=1 Tax=Vibrio owensii TaxID=696485 RepID=UPI003CC5B51F